MHFTPKTYDIIIYIKDLLKMPYAYYKKLVPSMSWEVIEFFKIISRYTNYIRRPYLLTY